MPALDTHQAFVTQPENRDGLAELRQTRDVHARAIIELQGLVLKLGSTVRSQAQVINDLRDIVTRYQTRGDLAALTLTVSTASANESQEARNARSICEAVNSHSLGISQLQGRIAAVREDVNRIAAHLELTPAAPKEPIGVRSAIAEHANSLDALQRDIESIKQKQPVPTKSWIVRDPKGRVAESFTVPISDAEAAEALRGADGGQAASGTHLTHQTP